MNATVMMDGEQPAAIAAGIRHLGDGKPCIAVMGEFSSGKSTVINLLLESSDLPTNVTATQLPAIWLGYGDAQKAVGIGHDGSVTALPDGDLSAPDLRRFALVRLERPDPALRHFDVIDTPGLSDPTLDADFLSVPVALADALIWCTPANQAWRQSEVGVWRQLPPAMRRHGMLLVTRADVLGTERDRSKVRRRLQAEAGQGFDRIQFISSRDALSARRSLGVAKGNFVWHESGGAETIQWIVQTVAEIAAKGVNQVRAARTQTLPESGICPPLARPMADPIPEEVQSTGEEPEGATNTAQETEEWRGPSPSEEVARTELRVPGPEPEDAASPDGLGTPSSSASEPGDQPVQTQEKTMSDMKPVSSTDISALSEIAGFIGGCLVDSDTGLMLGAEGGANFDLEAAAAGNTEVVKAKHAAKAALGLDDYIEDILITLGTQYHLIRPLQNMPSVFLYVALDRKTANLGMARIKVKAVEQTVSL